MLPFDIRRSISSDVQYLSHLQAKFSNQLGFLPKPALECYAGNGWASIGTENGSEAGYILGRPQYRWQPLMSPITQAAVAMDAQRRGLGLALVSQWVARATIAGKHAVQCICANDIEAMSFWPAAGFTAICEIDPANARGRKMTVWRRSLLDLPPTWFFNTPPVSGHKARRTPRGQLFLFSGVHMPAMAAGR